MGKMEITKVKLTLLSTPVKFFVCSLFPYRRNNKSQRWINVVPADQKTQKTRREQEQKKKKRKRRREECGEKLNVERLHQVWKRWDSGGVVMEEAACTPLGFVGVLWVKWFDLDFVQTASQWEPQDWAEVCLRLRLSHRWGGWGFFFFSFFFFLGNKCLQLLFFFFWRTVLSQWQRESDWQHPHPTAERAHW